MIVCYLFTFLMGVTHAPGWSEPVISIEVPDYDYHKKDILVTDENHVHQLWTDFENEQKVGYNIVLPDGSVLVQDTLFSRDAWSANPSLSYVHDSGVIGFWREYTPKWYSVKDNEGNTLIPATIYSSEGWTSWPRIDSSLDSLGRIHMVWDSGPDICYSILDPGVGEVWRDTIPDSRQQSLVLVDGNRVHIKFNGLDQFADYIQYDLDGNVTIPAVDLVESGGEESNWCSMAVDNEGNAYIFVFEYPDVPRRLCLYKVDGINGEVLIDGAIIYESPPSKSLNDPIILSTSSGEQFYLLWREEDPWSSDYRWIKFAVIDTNGDFVEEPYIAYDYTDEEPESLMRLAATTNSIGDVFMHWSAFYPEESMYYIVLGWFDHNWLGIEEESDPVDMQIGSILVPSVNPFNESVIISICGDDVSSSLKIYDISGHLVDEILPSAEGTYLWNGTSQDGNELPCGNYIIKSDNSDIEPLTLTKN